MQYICTKFHKWRTYSGIKTKIHIFQNAMSSKVVASYQMQPRITGMLHYCQALKTSGQYQEWVNLIPRICLALPISTKTSNMITRKFACIRLTYLNSSHLIQLTTETLYGCDVPRIIAGTHLLLGETGVISVAGRVELQTHKLQLSCQTTTPLGHP